MGIGRTMIQFTIKANACRRPHILEKHAFAPPMMGKYDIRCKTAVAQPNRSEIAGFGPNNLGFQIRHPRMPIFPISTRNSIGNHINTLPSRRLFHLWGQGNHLIPPRGQSGPQVFILPWEILVNQQYLHKMASLLFLR